MTSSCRSAQPFLAKNHIRSELHAKSKSRRQDATSNGSFIRKKVLETASCDESPYAMMVSVHEHRLTENDGADLATLPSPSLALDWDNSIEYNIKKL